MARTSGYGLIMACNNPTSPIPTLRELLTAAYIAFTSESNILRHYTEYRDALLEVVTATGIDHYAYMDSLRLIQQYGDQEAESLALLGGSEERLRELVKQSYQSLPMETSL
ncbi:hypothetical protein [Spirosoma validum]|uniref:Uncharacterized protein n=1 Tax=Spirosoma validum TaxID=2771355 RepID=A0A927B1N2_9BACT|nr:hypothetical protein [Spirosoma validum]MBD2753734.1 hypothetical protein [Spirosoma validum]